MRRSTKVLVGLGAVTAVSVGAAIAISDRVSDRLKNYKARHDVKDFVEDNLNGNALFMDLVDVLNDQEIEALSGIIKKMEDRKKNVRIEGKNFSDMKEEVTDRLVGFLESFTE